MDYYYVYVILSHKDHQFYTGYSSNLKKRLQEHYNGVVSSTKNRLPVTLIYWEGCLSRQDATKREKYLKTAWGKRYLKNRLKYYLTG
ncbi:MAG: GIY-YIG nuclease family protein [bacterium]